MALIKCKECKTEISSKAKNCPKCGAPQKKGGCGSCLGGALIVLIAALGLPMLSNKTPHDWGHESAPTGIPSQQNSPNFFGRPQDLANALISEGLMTDGWRPSRAFPGQWLCMTPLTPFGSKGSALLENNIAYYVNGSGPTSAHEIIIKININNPRERNEAFLRLAKAAKRLFTEIAEPVPSPLVDALAQQQAASTTTHFGSVELIYEPGNIDSFKIVLKAKPST